MSPKFGNSSNSMREVIITSILKEFDQKKQFFLRSALDPSSVSGTGTNYGIKILHQCGKKVKTKSRKVLVANLNVCRSLFVPHPK